MKKHYRVVFAFVSFLLFSCQSAPKGDPKAQEKALVLAPREQVEAHGKKWIVSTQGKLTTEAAVQILKEGGNLVDAAIAASFAVSVERPQSTGLGGGGFMIYYEAKTKTAHVIDFRESGPENATAHMYLNEQGEVIPNKSITGGASIAVPGLVRGLAYIHKKWGKTKWKHLVEPAIGYAANGFPIYPHLANSIKEVSTDLEKFSASKNIFLNKNGSPKLLGDTLVQADLAKTLKAVAQDSENFYRGKIAHAIAHTAQKYQGILTEADLTHYKVKDRKAVIAEYKDYQIISMPPPSSGGIHVIQILKLLEHDDLATLGFLSPQAVHLTVQAMQQAFADRAKYLGDPDFVHVPVQGLIDDQYLAGLRKKFTEYTARKASDVNPGVVPAAPFESDNTSHMSLMDEEGNVVVTTQSVNGHLGSKIVAEGTGVVMNNTMDDFAAKPGAQNKGGAVGSAANKVEPGKRPLSSMSPTIVLKEGKPILALGAPGGTRIISAVTGVILNYLVYHQDLYQSVASVRIHHQWLPDEVTIENNHVPESLVSDLEKRGYTVKKNQTLSRVMAVAADESGLIGVSDPRDIGTSAGQ